MDVPADNNWNAELYDGKHSFVSTYGNDLVDLLNPKKGQHILDLGCGTGDLAKQLNDFGADVEGVDKSENMIEQAKTKYPNIKFAVEDATALEYKDEFDAVFSNAALHWVKPPKKALYCIYNSLKENGRFVAEFGGKGNVHRITTEIRNQLKALGLPYYEDRFPWFFPSVGEYTTLMEEVGFRVTFANHFDRPTPLEGETGLRHWMEMFGKTMFEEFDNESVHKVITNVENNLKESMFKENKWIADYKRIRVIGKKSK
ncbi:class I SAM-dependent methyltransferase [Salibacterium sp. K-3]